MRALDKPVCAQLDNAPDNLDLNRAANQSLQAAELAVCVILTKPLADSHLSTCWSNITVLQDSVQITRSSPNKAYFMVKAVPLSLAKDNPK